MRTIKYVDSATQALLFALLGAVLGGAAILAWRVSEIQQQRASEVDEPPLPDGVAAVLSVLRSSALVVDSEDNVLKATAPAHSMGVMSDEHLADEQLLDQVRQVRRDGQIREFELIRP
ncbi:MAG: two-component sensor histidine kinase, partial [Actinomycetota bacterium]|nr:two-component sensor histidine kinase [Actinomycetota bacterium]